MADKHLGQLAFVRTIRELLNQVHTFTTLSRTAKRRGPMLMHANKREDLEEASGEIVAIGGMKM